MALQHLKQCHWDLLVSLSRSDAWGCILVNVGILECVSHPCWIWVHVHFCELLVQLGHFFFGILHKCGRPNFQVCNSGAQTVEILGTFGLKLLKTDGARCINLLGLFLNVLLHLLKLSVHLLLTMFKNLLGGGLQNSLNTSRKFFSVGSTLGGKLCTNILQSSLNFFTQGFFQHFLGVLDPLRHLLLKLVVSRHMTVHCLRKFVFKPCIPILGVFPVRHRFWIHIHAYRGEGGRFA